MSDSAKELDEFFYSRHDQPVKNINYKGQLIAKWSDEKCEICGCAFNGTWSECISKIDQRITSADDNLIKIKELHAIITECKTISENKGKEAIQAAIKCGSELSKAKAKLGHGLWLPWLKENFPFCDKTAENYMRLDCDVSNSQHIADLVSNATSLRQAYLETGIIKKPKKIKLPKEKNEPTDYTKVKGYANKIWELLTNADEPDKMLVQIEPIIEWYRNYMEQKELKTLSKDGFDFFPSVGTIPNNDPKETDALTQEITAKAGLVFE